MEERSQISKQIVKDLLCEEDKGLLFGFTSPNERFKRDAAPSAASFKLHYKKIRNMLDDDSIVNRYINIWTSLVDSLEIFRKYVEKKIFENDEINIHQILKNIYWIPKYEMIKYLNTTLSNPNPGSFTGLFFENIIGVFIEPYIKKRVHLDQIGRNFCDDDNIKSSIQRDPDFYFKSNNNKAIIEVKVAPKKDDLESIIILREKCISQDVGFYFIGGWVSASRADLYKLAGEDWISILDGSNTNKQIIEEKFYKIDDMLDNICKYLNRL